MQLSVTKQRVVARVIHQHLLRDEPQPGRVGMAGSMGSRLVKRTSWQKQEAYPPQHMLLNSSRLSSGMVSKNVPTWRFRKTPVAPLKPAKPGGTS